MPVGAPHSSGVLVGDFFWNLRLRAHSKGSTGVRSCDSVGTPLLFATGVSRCPLPSPCERGRRREESKSRGIRTILSGSDTPITGMAQDPLEDLTSPSLGAVGHSDSRSVDGRTD